ncbi:MAG: peptidase S9, partial [Muribaculaceae bacterium]|nr:peptidase S9 [Muribaculaceae bacterium]
MKKSIAIMASAAIIASCSSSDSKDDAKLIDRPDYKSETGLFDDEALEALGRVSNPQVSPDGKKILFGISYESVEQNKSNNELYLLDVE